MLATLAKIIPLDLAATLSPGIFAVAIILLGNKFHPKIKVLSFLFGTLIVGIAIALAGFFLGQATPTDSKSNLATAIVDLALAIIFIILAIKVVYSKERHLKTQEDSGYQIIKWLILGFIISATNFDALFLSFTAAKEVGGTGDIGSLAKMILLVVNLFFFSLPITLPLFLYLVFPNLAVKILEKINLFVLKYSRYILAGLFLIFGFLLLWRGINYFLSTSQTSAMTSKTTTSETSTQTFNSSFVLPIGNYKTGQTKKVFGQYITPQNSPVQPEKFTGYHTGVDIEQAQDNADVPVYSIADGVIKYTNYVSGYGGVIIIEFSYQDQAYTALYGHIRLSSASISEGDKVSKGQQLAVLGTSYSSETNGERKHLHFAIHKGNSIDYRGYVQNQSELSDWIDPNTIIN